METLNIFRFCFVIFVFCQVTGGIKVRDASETKELYDNGYISLNKNNINDYLGIKDNEFFFNLSCKSFLLFDNIKNYFWEKLLRSKSKLETVRSKQLKTENLEDVENEINESWNKESENFLLTTRNLIEQYTTPDVFTLQIGLTSLTSMIFKKIKNITFVEEDAELCKKFFLNKKNRCLFYFEGIEVYCKKKENSIPDNKFPTTATLNILKEIYQKRKPHLIDILIVNHKYTVALLYYIFPYVDPSTLVIVVDQMNYKMKNAIYSYYNFLGETSFLPTMGKSLIYKGNGKENEKENENELNELTFFEKKKKYSSLCITTLTPQMIIQPPEDHYKTYISDEYTVTTGNELSFVIYELYNFLKSQTHLYKRYNMEITHYVNSISDFDMHIDHKELKEKILKNLSAINAESKKENIVIDGVFHNALENLKKSFEEMLLHVFNHSEFKLYFMPFMDFLKYYIKQNSYYHIFQFLLYELMNESFDIISYEIKEFVFLDILREGSKNIKNMSDVEAIETLIKLIIVLKKIKAREDKNHIKELAKEFNVTYKDYEL